MPIVQNRRRHYFPAQDEHIITGLRAIQKIALVEIDPGDGSVRPNLEYVLIRGFSAMGWAQPSLAAHQLMESIAQSIAASKSHD